jgi:hypothetical protein
MTHKQIEQIEDTNLKRIMKLIKKLDTNQKKLHKLFKPTKDENNNQ